MNTATKFDCPKHLICFLRSREGGSPLAARGAPISTSARSLVMSTLEYEELEQRPGSAPSPLIEQVPFQIPMCICKSHTVPAACALFVQPFVLTEYLVLYCQHAAHSSLTA